MKTRKELAFKTYIRILNQLQEELMINKSFTIPERINVVSYIDNVKAELQRKMISKEVISDEITQD